MGKEASCECKKCGLPTPSPRARYCDRCRPSKYKSRGCVVGGKHFHSKKESLRYAQLSGMEEAGLITRLRCQPRFPLTVDGDLICVYVGDFSYIDQRGVVVVEDVKSKYTAKLPEYRMKKKLMKAINKIDIVEII